MNYQEVKDLVVKGLLVGAPLKWIQLDGQNPAVLQLRPPKDSIYIPIFVIGSQGEAATKIVYFQWNDNGLQKVMGSESVAQSVRSYLYNVVSSPMPLICTYDSFLECYTTQTAAQWFALMGLVYQIDGVEKIREGNQ